MINNITFDEPKVLKAIEDLLVKAFKEDDEKDNDFWFNIIKDIEVIKENAKSIFLFNVTILNPYLWKYNTQKNNTHSLILR